MNQLTLERLWRARLPYLPEEELDAAIERYLQQLRYRQRRAKRMSWGQQAALEAWELCGWPPVIVAWYPDRCRPDQTLKRRVVKA